MGKARNLSVLLAADGQVEDAKIDGLTSSKLTGNLPALDGSSLTNVVATSGVATDATKLPLAGGALTGAVTTNSTFDGRDVATDGTKLDGIATSANNYSLPSSVIHESELSSSTSSTSTTTAANLAGVKAAYDKGNHSHPYASSTATATLLIINSAGSTVKTINSI